MALINFDAAEYAGKAKIDPLPAGAYKVVITESEYKESQNGGHYFSLTSEVVDGEYQGRKVFIRLCVDNTNPKTVEMAKSDLGLICKAVGIPSPKDTSELHNIPFMLTMKVKEDKQTGEMVNEIKTGSYKPVETAPAYQKTNTAPWVR